MLQLRPFRTGDESALAEICIRTADAGADATGILADDAIWPAVFVLPYVARHPDLAFVVEDEDGRPVGYVVGTDDTAAFEDWFAHTWWPERGAGWPKPRQERTPSTRAQTRQDGVLTYAYGRRAGAEPYGREHPAHLHIDLLPEAQGEGWGRRLIDAFVAAVRARGVTGLHLAADTTNTGALRFYDRLGFTRVPSHAGVQAFTLDL